MNFTTKHTYCSSQSKRTSYLFLKNKFYLDTALNNLSTIFPTPCPFRHFDICKIWLGQADVAIGGHQYIANENRRYCHHLLKV